MSVVVRFTAALVAALACLALLAAVPASAAASSDESELFQLTNQSRAANGKAALAYDDAASGVARGWAQNLARTGVLQHNPDLRSQVDASVTTQWTRLGENVGYAGSIATVHQLYMNSPGHKANILGSYNRVGVGTARDGAGRVWTTVVFLMGPALPTVNPTTFRPFTSADHLVRQQYVDVLGRTADSGGLSSWTSSLNAGTAPANVASAMLTSAEQAQVGTPVTRLYFAYFDRSPDVGGLDYWRNELRRGRSLSTVSNGFAASTEFRNTYGSLSNQQFVELVYRNVLDRNPDPGGLLYWVGRLSSRALDRGGVMIGFSESTEFRNVTVHKVPVVMAYLGMLRRSPESSAQQSWISQLQAGQSVTTLVSSIMGSQEYANRF